MRRSEGVLVGPASKVTSAHWHFSCAKVARVDIAVRPGKYVANILGLSVAFAASCAAPPGLTQDPQPVQRDVDQAANSQFGYSLATSADLAILGAPFDDDSGLNSGSAYVFDGSIGWGQVAELTASDEAAGDQFGYSVAISGDLAIVGAWGDDDGGSASGSAYIFNRSTGWSQVAKLTALDAARGDEFGYSVAISGNLAVIGARLDRDSGSASGSAYVFDGSIGWGQVAELTASDAAANDQFGTSVAISGDLAVVGAPGDRDGGPDSGSAYLFDGSTGWSQSAKLTASDAAAVDRFGTSVGINGDLSIVGAPLDDDGGPDSGSAYLFDGSTSWSQVAKLSASDGAALDQFGYSVAMGDDLAIVGAWGDDDGGSASGAAYVFDGSTGWNQLAKLTASDAAAGDQFACSVASSGNLAIAGARLDDDRGSASGSAYVFDRSIGWSQVAKLTDSDAAALADSPNR